MRWLRFDFETGDAGGQNMVTKATRDACVWMVDQGLDGLEHFTLAANLDTDKKHSFVNNLHTRGKRVVAEIVLPGSLIEEVMHTSSRALFELRQAVELGELRGRRSEQWRPLHERHHRVIACGQDVANVAEAAAGFTHAELRDNGDYYFSITIPSLIVATCGGGTGLATQRECREVMGCYGPGKVRRLAEIVAATVLCGEVSLGSAIVAAEWVSSHVAYGRNPPAEIGGR